MALSVLGKSLPLISQQQPRFNYKRRVYSAHTKGIPSVPNLDDRGGCATEAYRTPTTLGRTTKTMSDSSERTLKAAREKHLVTYRGVPIRRSAGFSKETL